MTKWTNKRVRVKAGFYKEGRIGTAIGEPVHHDREWVPVVWDDEVDPTLFNKGGLEFLPSDRERGR